MAILDIAHSTARPIPAAGHDRWISSWSFLSSYALYFEGGGGPRGQLLMEVIIGSHWVVLGIDYAVVSLDT